MNCRGAMVWVYWKDEKEAYKQCGIEWGPWVLTYAAPLTVSGKKLSDAVIKVYSEEGILSGRVVASWSCPELQRCFANKLEGWQYTWDDESDPEFLSQASSSFLLLATGRRSDWRSPLSSLLRALPTPPPQKGAALLVESTPFACPSFFNSWNRGVVSNVFGQDGSLLLTDARLVPGCEGAPIFLLSKEEESVYGRNCYGMVLFPMLTVRGETLSFSLGASLHSIIRAAFNPQPALSSIYSLKGGDESVVLVRCGSSWGTGCVVGDGVIISCAHVIRYGNMEDDSVSVHINGNVLQANLVFSTAKDSFYDFAVIEVENAPFLKPFKLGITPPVKGERVLAVGHCLLSEKEKPYTATQTSGIVSNVSSIFGPMQTTCIIHTGASGGAIVRPNGELIGIITFNIIDNKKRAAYPCINLCIPISAVVKPLNKYLSTRDSEELKVIAEKDPKLAELWSLRCNL